VILSATAVVPPIGVDLALHLDPALPAPLCRAAGPLADPQRATGEWERLLAAWLADLAPSLPPRLQAAGYSLSLSLCDDPAIAALNEEWRERPGPTDVLAFAACDEAEDGPPLPLPPAGEEGDDALELGDIVISLETAARQAEEEGHGLDRELLFLASHGLLHLLGWDHPDDASLAAMLARQEQLLSRWR
jgi:probable rRNA maturation factor